jgi:hypothetical protein
MKFRIFNIVIQSCIISLFIVTISPAFQTTPLDVFPLHINLHYKYDYRRTIDHYYHMYWSSTQSDSGRVEYIVRDSLQLNIHWIVWTVDRISHLLHRYESYDKFSPDTEFLQIDTVQIYVKEYLSGDHKIEVPEDIIYFESPFQKCISPWSGITVNRYSGQDSVTLSLTQYLYIDTSVFIRSKGLVCRKKSWHYWGMSEIIDNLVVEQISPPIVNITHASRSPEGFMIMQNYPNPFNPRTVIRYAVPVASHVTVGIYNTLGQHIAELVNSEQHAGWHESTWNANVSSGLYFYRIDAVSTTDPQKRFTQLKKMLLLK